MRPRRRGRHFIPGGTGGELLPSNIINATKDVLCVAVRPVSVVEEIGGLSGYSFRENRRGEVSTLSPPGCPAVHRLDPALGSVDRGRPVERYGC